MQDETKAVHDMIDIIIDRERNAMQLFRPFLILLLMAWGVFQSTPADAGFGDFLKSVKRAVEGDEELSESKTIDGLKEALRIGTGNAVEKVSQAGGYYDNSQIKIPLPGAIQKVETLVRAAGYGAQVDAFEMSMNRAAERAAPEAKGIFWDAIKEMTFSDARKILQGRENEATLYFKDKTYSQLSEVFQPIVHEAMSEVGVTRKYQELDEKIRAVPFASSVAFDLDEYVKSGALDGLFFMLGEEERKIRQDPAARVTDLLKETFGNR
jgi:hypothetical protein